MKWNKRFIYPKSSRSLTTILSQTQSEEKKKSLADWRAKMGPEAADKVKDVAAERGTAMHRYLEAYIDGTGHKDLTALGVQAETMANKIIESGLKDLGEVWGSEVTLHYPGLYAGQTDVVGVYDGQPAIIDFKQTNKPKKREWINDYFEQLGAYCMAHNYVYGTKIQSGIILMCSKDFLFQKFEVSGKEFVKHQHNFLKKVDQFYQQKPRETQNVPEGEDHQNTKNDPKVQ